MRIVVIVLLLIAVAGGFFIWRPRFGSSENVWRVVFIDKPEVISTAHADLTSVSYLLQQTHKTILTRTSAGKFESEILASWERDVANKNFLFCPIDRLEFDAGVPFTARELMLFLKEKFGNILATVSLDRGDTCTKISLKIGNSEFVKNLTKMTNAPTKMQGTQELGLGAFKVETNDKQKIILVRKKASSSKEFSKIEVYPQAGVVERLKEAGSFQDINRMSKELVPAWVGAQYNKYENVLLQNFIVLLNISDFKLRESVYNCLNVSQLRQAFSPGYESYRDVSTIIPIGMRGAVGGAVSQNCQRLTQRLVVSFLNWKNNNQSKLSAFFEKIERESGIKIDIENIDPNDLPKRVFAKKYQITVIAIDSPDFDHRDFYRDILSKKNSLYGFDTAVGLTAPIENTNFDDLKNVTYIEKFIVEKKLALPLFQQNKMLYYPPNVGGVDFGSNSLETPIVEKLSYR